MTRQRGRPSGFDRHDALESAMRAFWAQGYEGTSVDKLCRAMNMPRASLYQNYGDKEGLFLAAIDRYGETRVSILVASLGPNGSLEDDLNSFYEQVISLATSDTETRGCLISCVLAEAAGTNRAFMGELDRRFGALEARIEARLLLENWPESLRSSPRTTAGMVAAVARGLTLRARSGQTIVDLSPIAATAVAAVVGFLASVGPPGR